MLAAFYIFWFHPHQFFKSLTHALRTKTNAKKEAFYINSLWLGTMILVLASAYPVALLCTNVFRHFSFIIWLASYFVGAILISIVYALILYRLHKDFHPQKNEPGWVIFNYAALFDHAIITSNLLIVYVPLGFYIPSIQYFFHSEVAEAITVPVLVAILRLFPKFFVAQAMHENNQPSK